MWYNKYRKREELLKTRKVKIMMNNNEIREMVNNARDDKIGIELAHLADLYRALNKRKALDDKERAEVADLVKLANVLAEMVEAK